MSQTTVQSVERAFEALDCLSLGSLNLAGLSQALGVSAPGALKIVKTLESLGMVRQMEDKRYELAVGCGRYALAYCRQHPLRDVARPAMEDLALATGDRVVLSILEAERQMTLLAVDPRLGWRHPELEVASGPHLSLQLATGRVLLAYAPPECARRQFAAYPPERLPPDLATFADVEALLERVRRDDHAIVPTPQMHVRFLGVPIRGREGRVVAALGLHVAEPRTMEDALALARQAAARIAESILS